MHPAKVRREAVRGLTDLPNVGKATAADLHRLGIYSNPPKASYGVALPRRTGLCEDCYTYTAPAIVYV